MSLLIKNFDQFLDALNLCDIGVYTYEEVIQSAEIEAQGLEPHVNWIEETVSVSSILKKDNFEVFLYCWEPGQETPMISQSGKAWFRVVEGELTVAEYEQNGEKPKLVSENAVGEGDCMELPPIYGLTNAGDMRCKSIHLEIS